MCPDLEEADNGDMLSSAPSKWPLQQRIFAMAIETVATSRRQPGRETRPITVAVAVPWPARARVSDVAHPART